MVATARSQSERRRALEHCLKGFEFERVAAPGRKPHAERARPVQLRLCLEAMGPLFAAFGRYLATRIDLVPEPLGETLAAIPDEAPPANPDEVREMYTRELGCPVDLAFRTFDPEPFQARLFWQAHRAQLGDASVIVKVIRPDIGRLAADAGHLPLLEPVLTSVGIRPEAGARAIADFQRHIPALQTWESDLATFRLLARDEEAFEHFGVPPLYAHLSTPHVSVLGHWTTPGGFPAPAAGLARALSTVWLRQALVGSAFPVEPTAENLGLAADGRCVFPCGPFAGLPEEAKSSLWNYLLAVAANNPDLAATHLAAAMGGALTPGSCEEMRRRFRQMVPSREGFRGIGSGGWPVNRQPFAEQILIHWRIASEIGSLSDALISFFRGLLGVARTVRMLAPDQDWMAEAVRDLRLLMAFGEIRDALRPSQMVALLEDYAEAIMAMPETLERVFASAEVPASPAPPGGSELPRSQNRLVRGLCLLLALAAAGMLAHKIAASGAGGSALAALAFLAVGLFFLYEGVR